MRLTPLGIGRAKYEDVFRQVEIKRYRVPRKPWPAIEQGVTNFPSQRRHPRDTQHQLLKPGTYSGKVGGKVYKGPLRGYTIYTLTLEERASCPKTCERWEDCLHPLTKVLLADLSWVSARDLEVGARIVAFDEKPHKQTNRRRTKVGVVKKLGRAQRDSYCVVTDQGQMTASAGHLWLARLGREGFRWWRTDELTDRHEVAHFKKPWEQDATYGGARVRGFMEGEGYISHGDHSKGKGWKRTRAGWGQLPGKLLDEINELVLDRGFELSTADRKSGVNGSTLTLVDVKGGWREAARFLGTFRPTRLIERAEDVVSHHDVNGRSKPARVLRVVPVGKIEVVTIETSEKTLIADGFYVHNCYGNNMPYAKRVLHGAWLEARLGHEIAHVMHRHPDGVLLRLHVLGDFYSVEYVELWDRLLELYPKLAIFGYTAHYPKSAIGLAVRITSRKRGWLRFAIRFSTSQYHDDHCATWYNHGDRAPPRTFACPEQTDKVMTCGECGACWNGTKTVSFKIH